MTILVTGGCGFIGSHTIVDLIENGYDVISVDNNSRSNPNVLEGVSKITGKEIINYNIDLCDFSETEKIFERHNISGIIHFAAFKSVDESVKFPLSYFDNNLISQINILKCCEKFNVKYFVFSSSCSVYGNADEAPVTENTVLKKPESPYGRTKQIGEEMIIDISKVANSKFILLRYFNPVGAHPSGYIGETPYGRPSNLFPAITQYAAGKLSELKVYGTDYDTRDGSCVRDFIHVCDIAHAHTLAINFLIQKETGTNCEIFNLGSGNGVTVLEAIQAFERVTKIKLSYSIAGRRQGDVVSIYANNNKAKEQLKWVPRFTIDDMMRTVWMWETKSQLHK